MNTDPFWDDTPRAKEYWEWLLSPNLAAVGRVVFAVLWIRRSVLVLAGAWAIIRANWSITMLVLLFLGPGEIGFFIILAVVCFYALIPFGIYTYCVQKRIGALGNVGLNFAAVFVVELLLGYAGSMVMRYFLD